MHRVIAFVLAEGPARHGEDEDVTPPRESAPFYAGQSVPRQRVLGRHGNVLLKAYPPHVLIAECAREVEDAFSDDAFALRARMIEECRGLLEDRGADVNHREEFALAVVDGYEGPAERFLENGAAIARFLKSEAMALHPTEIARTLESRIAYARDDLVIVDWDGAFVFRRDGRAEPVVELLQLANLHLLQHRKLDGELDRRLRRIAELIRTKRASRVVFWNRELARAFKEVVRIRATSLIEYDAILREIKLIGDWYSARLYEITARKFRLEEWHRAIKDKLDNLEDAYGILAQNFRISRENFVELMLQAGWLVLILMELYLILQH